MLHGDSAVKQHRMVVCRVKTGDSVQERIQCGAKFAMVGVDRRRLQADISTKGKK